MYVKHSLVAHLGREARDSASSAGEGLPKSGQAVPEEQAEGEAAEP